MSFFWLKSQHKRIELQKTTTQNWQSPCVQTTTQDQAAWAMDVPQDVPWGWVAWGKGGLMPAEKWFLSGPALDHLCVEEMRENRPHNTVYGSIWRIKVLSIPGHTTPACTPRSHTAKQNMKNYPECSCQIQPTLASSAYDRQNPHILCK